MHRANAHTSFFRSSTGSDELFSVRISLYAILDGTLANFPKIIQFAGKIWHRTNAHTWFFRRSTSTPPIDSGERVLFRHLAVTGGRRALGGVQKAVIGLGECRPLCKNHKPPHDILFELRGLGLERWSGRRPSVSNYGIHSKLIRRT